MLVAIVCLNLNHQWLNCFSILQVAKVTHVEGNDPVKFSTETSFVVDKYEIL